MRNRKWLFYLVTAIFWFSLYTYVPYVAPFAREMGASYRLVGLIGGAYGFTQMVIRFPLGIFSDKIGRRKIFVQLGLLFAAAAGTLVFFLPSPNSLLLARAFGGVAASSWVTFTVLGASYFPPDKTTKSMGYLSACNAAGRMVAALAGGLIAQQLGVEHAFLLGGIFGITGLFIGFGIVEKRVSGNIEPPIEISSENSPSFAELLNVAKNKQLLSCSVLAILSMFVAFATTFSFTPLAAAHLDAGNFQIGMLLVVSTVPGIFMAPLAGTIMPQKLGAAATIVIGFLLAGLGSALVAVSRTLLELFIVQIISSVGGAILGTLLLGLCIRDIAPPRRAAAMGFFQAVYGIGMFLGPFVTGQISHAFGLSPAFIFTGIIGLVGAVLTIFYARKGYLAY
ncbi:MAG: MFS transporter [Defluviitaleaceae bacterium]|nr:MFS transporter [Defluviitaleaceae bacterium]